MSCFGNIWIISFRCRKSSWPFLILCQIQNIGASLGRGWVEWNRSVFTRSESFSECWWRRALKERDEKSFQNSREDYLFNLTWPDTLGGALTFCPSWRSGADVPSALAACPRSGGPTRPGGEKHSKTRVKQTDQLGGWSTLTS